MASTLPHAERRPAHGASFARRAGVVAVALAVTVALAPSRSMSGGRSLRTAPASGGATSADLAPRRAYAREWWTVWAHAADARGRRFAVHATFFRYALGGGAELLAAEYAVLDARTERFTTGARSERVATPARAIAIGDWTLRGDRSARVAIAGRDGFALALAPLKAAVASPASDGYAFTRMRASGEVTLAGVRRRVRGLAWLDHDYEHADARPRIGRQRFELQLLDGDDVEVLVDRRAGAAAGSERDGEREPATAVIVDARGRAQPVAAADVHLVERGTTLWRSPRDAAAYPALWRLGVPGKAMMAVAPLRRDQETSPGSGGVAAWFGAVDAAQAYPPGLPLGDGVAELTGYAAPSPL